MCAILYFVHSADLGMSENRPVTMEKSPEAPGAQAKSVPAMDQGVRDRNLLSMIKNTGLIVMVVEILSAGLQLHAWWFVEEYRFSAGCAWAGILMTLFWMRWRKRIILPVAAGLLGLNFIGLSEARMIQMGEQGNATADLTLMITGSEIALAGVIILLLLEVVWRLRSKTDAERASTPV